MKGVARRYMPPPPPGARPPAPLWSPGVLEGLVEEAGLTPEQAFDTRWAFEYADEQALLRGLLAAGGIGATAGPEREPELRAALVAALAPFRTPGGGYRLENEWHYLVARA
jgi:hypothetical protein